MTMTPDEMRDAILDRLKYAFGKDPAHAQLSDFRLALSMVIRDRIVDPWFASTRATYAAGAKRVYYLSMEFLIGRLLQDAVVNLGLFEAVDNALGQLGFDTRSVLADEPDAALGNGGLGRLAACFLESLSTIGCPGYGYGIRYEHGLFRQSFSGGRQIESPEDWLRQINTWEFHRPEVTYEIGFGGSVTVKDGRHRWAPAEAVVAKAHDTPVIGWGGRWANTLRLWEAQPIDVFDLARFNRGEYAAAAEPEAWARTISRVLYPDDTTPEGKRLRLKQEYFFTATSLRDILRRFLSEHDDLRQLPDKVAIQLNDTHPAIAGPELVRLLHDEHGLPLGEALDLGRRTLNYTNHTLLPEALERWSVALMSELLPRHMRLIEEIDDSHARANPGRDGSIIDGGEVKMGDLAFVMANRVNGVSALHTGLMKETVFSGLHRLHPSRIVNQTNGVTPRRWLLSANPRLARVITDSIGSGWVDNLEQLAGLEDRVDDPAFAQDFAAAKRANKQDLSNWLVGQGLPATDPDAMFDIQIKRIHEYKRQHMNILEAVAAWLELKDDPGAARAPRVRIFGGKAAPGYVLAKEIIYLINSVASVVNADPQTRELLQVLYPANYNVSLAERLIPAADLSQQISTAGKEASGTGNMKFALNGAPTLGTLDGANVEIRDRVGADNFFLFGMTAPEAEARRHVPGHAGSAIAADPRLSRALDAIRSGMFSNGVRDHFAMVTNNIEGADYFLVASDFTDYWRASREAEAAFADRPGWVRRAALNTARSGWFSSDRTIRGYMADVWGAKAVETG